MKRFSKKTLFLTAAFLIVVILTVTTAFAPSADKARNGTDYLTVLSPAMWTAPEVYSDGYTADNIMLDGESVSGEFAFEKNSVITVNLPESLSGKRKIGMLYRAENADTSDVLFALGYKDVTYTAYLPLIWQDDTGEQRYPTDRYGNERSNPQSVNGGTVFSPLSDNADINTENILLDISGGVLRIENISQTVFVKEIRLYEEKGALSYTDYVKSHSGTAAGSGKVTVQGEDYSVKSDAHIKSSNVNNTALTPYDTYHRMINTLDASFSGAGQKVMWEFEVESNGWYEIGLKFCQNSAVNKKVYRKVEIDGSVPFEELSAVTFPQTENLAYSTLFFSDGNENPYKIYLTAGRHTVALVAEMGEHREVYDRLKALIDRMNDLGMDITKITAGVNDKNRSWDLDAYLPNAVSDMNSYIEELNAIYEKLEEIEGQKPTYADSLLYAVKVLERLLKKPRTIPNNLELFNTGDNSAVKHANTVLNKLIKLDLAIDEIYINAEGETPVKKSTSLFTKLSDSVKKFIYSLSSEAIAGNGGATKNKDTLKVWMSRSSVYVQVLQSMADSAAELEGVSVDISIMPSEQKLVLAAAAGTNPDAVLGVLPTTPYKFAIRGAAKDLTEYRDFLSFYNSEYNLEALVPCAYNGGIYGATETQDYHVLFYRKDILETLNIDVPNTWDDVEKIMPTLLRYNKNFSLPISNLIGFKTLSTTTPYLYQNGGSLYAENGNGAAFLEQNNIDGMKKLTDLFKIYAVDDYVASFYNSFRYGNTPIGIGGVSMYVQLSEAAPELAGLWDIAPAPGTLNSDGSVTRLMNNSTTSCMIFKNTEMSEEAWRFLKWWLSAETQTEFASSMELSYGTEYRWNTANMKAFDKSSYSDEHKAVIRVAWENQKENVQHPANYIVERELSNAFTNAVVNGDTVIEALEFSKNTADREIKRKLKEFGYCDNEGNIIKDYPTQVMRDIENRLKEQTMGEAEK